MSRWKTFGRKANNKSKQKKWLLYIRLKGEKDYTYFGQFDTKSEAKYQLKINREKTWAKPLMNSKIIYSKPLSWRGRNLNL
jgi:hypothetical protein